MEEPETSEPGPPSPETTPPDLAKLWETLITNDFTDETERDQTVAVYGEITTLKLIAEEVSKASLEDRRLFRKCVTEPGYEQLLTLLFNEDTDAQAVEGVALSLAGLSPEIEENSQTKPEIVKVKKAKVYREPDENIFRIGSSPRGFALLINNNDFDTERRGSKIDFDSLQQLFKELSFAVCPYENLTAAEMWKCVVNFAEYIDHSATDCVVVAIGSHGTEQRILGVDQDYLILEEIYARFNNVALPSMKNKPKLFIIQACRGDEHDQGTDAVDAKSLPSDLTFDAAVPETIESDNRIPSWTEMAIIQSTLPGYISNRFIDRGSWFVLSFVKVFMEHACDLHLVDLMRLVNKEVMKQHSFDGEKQASELILRGWTKNLYFNPGLDDPDATCESPTELSPNT